MFNNEKLTWKIVDEIAFSIPQIILKRNIYKLDKEIFVHNLLLVTILWKNYSVGQNELYTNEL